MKVRILDGCGYRGTMLKPGVIVDVPDPQDFCDLLCSGRAVALDRNDHARAAELATKAALLNERRGQQSWRQR